MGRRGAGDASPRSTASTCWIPLPAAVGTNRTASAPSAAPTQAAKAGSRLSRTGTNALLVLGLAGVAVVGGYLLLRARRKPAETPGLEIVRNVGVHGFSEAEGYVRYTDVRVPADMLVGEEHGGRGRDRETAVGGRIVVVTGASSGIGEETARRVAAAGGEAGPVHSAGLAVVGDAGDPLPHRAREALEREARVRGELPVLGGHDGVLHDVGDVLRGQDLAVALGRHDARDGRVAVLHDDGRDLVRLDLARLRHVGAPVAHEEGEQRHHHDQRDTGHAAGHDTSEE